MLYKPKSFERAIKEFYTVIIFLKTISQLTSLEYILPFNQKNTFEMVQALRTKSKVFHIVKYLYLKNIIL